MGATSFSGGAGTSISQAAQSAMEAETNEDTYIPPDLLKHSPGVAKAWCGITLAGALETPSYNIASVTDTGTGDRTIVFDTDFSTIVYGAGHAFVDLPSLSGFQYNFGSQAVGGIQLAIWNEGDAAADVPSLQVFFGDQS